MRALSVIRTTARARWHVGLVSAVAASTLLLTAPRMLAADDEEHDKAREVAALVQSFYNRTRTFQADFYQTYYHKLYDRYERSHGEVVFKKPGKMRWDYDKPNGKVIVSNGERLKVFDPGAKGEVAQLFVHELSEHQLPQAFSFLTGSGKLEDEFTFRLLDPKKQGFAGGHVLELRPRKTSPHYDRLLFYVKVIEVGGRRAGVVPRVLIVDPAGNRNRFDFSNMKFNRSVPDGRFEFTPPEGTRRVRP